MGKGKALVLPVLVGGLLSTAAFAPALAQDGPMTAHVTTQEELENPADGDWLHIHHTYNGHRFAEQDEINRDTVGDLRVAFTLGIAGVHGGASRYANTQLEGTPLVEGGIMYFPSGWGEIYAVDVTAGDHANVLWRMDPDIDEAWAGDVACCGVENRGVALYRDQIISSALDGRVIATNKATGEVTWEITVADPGFGETITVGPQVVDNIGIVGSAGAEYGIRGFIVGVNLDDGTEAWRTFTVAGPDEPGGETWMADGTYQNGGGSIWVTGTYDPALDLAYWGTGNPGPDWDAEYRPGDNLYTDSVLAITPGNGEIVWYHQYTPNDPFDYDEIGEHVLIDVEINGEMRSVATHAARNGHVYTFDRATGEFLYATQYVDTVSWTAGIDPKTGMPVEWESGADDGIVDYVAGAAARRDGTIGTQCPLITGGKNWEPSAYSPETGLLYIPGGEGCNQMKTEITLGPPDPRGFFIGADFAFFGAEAVEPANPDWVVEEYGSLAAFDVATGELVQKIYLSAPQRSGVMVTSGDLLFFGEPDGWVYAVDAHDLENTLWRFNVGTSIKAPPMSYEIDGKQYIAILVGSSIPGGPEYAGFAPQAMLYVFTL